MLKKFITTISIFSVLLFANSNLFGQYCTPAYSNGCNSDRIENFQFNTINQNSACSGSAFTFYSSVSTDVRQGCTYNYSVTFETFTQKFGIWIDFNGDGDFTDAGEKVVTQNSRVADQSGTISIPVTATVGTTRLRVRCSYDQNTTPCGSHNDGEAEDYVVNILPEIVVDAGPDQPAIGCPNNATLAGNDPGQFTGTWSVTSGAATFTNINSPTTTVTALGGGANVLRWTISDGTCDRFDEVTLTRSQVFAAAGPNQILCVDNTTMDGNNTTTIPGATGTWTLISGAGTITAPNLHNTTVTALGAGTNTFVWTVSDPSCTVTDTVDVTFSDIVTWTGNGTPGAWSDDANWDFGVPISCVNVRIPVTNNDPIVSNNITIQKLTIDSNALLTISNPGVLNLQDSMVLHGTLDNTGKFNMDAGKIFKMGPKGHYIHAPVVDALTDASIDMFKDGIEEFHATSTLTMKTWYDNLEPLYTNLQGDLGNLVINPNSGTDINTTAPQIWYQDNLLQDHIKGDLTLTKTRFVASTQPPIGTGFTDAINLTVGGKIIVNDALSQFIGLYHSNNSPTTPSSSNVTIAADEIIVSAGTFHAARNYHASGAAMSGNITVTTANGINVSGGLFVGGQSEFGANPGSLVTINSNIHTSNTAEFFGAHGAGISTNVIFSGSEILMEDASIIRGQAYLLGPSTGNFTVNGSNLTINGGTFQGIRSSNGAPTYNFGDVVLADSGTASVFDALYGGNGTLTTPVVLNANSIKVEGAGSVFNFNGQNGAGNVTGAITGDVLLNSGKINLTQETGSSILTFGGNLDINGGELNYFSNTATAPQNTDIINIQVNGNFSMTGGKFDFDKVAANTGATRNLRVKGHFNNNGGNFRAIKDEVSTVTFNGAFPQNISGATATTFRNVLFNNSTSVTLDTFNLTIENNTNMTGGPLHLAASDLILGANATAIAGAFDATTMISTDSLSFVHKKLSATGSYFFPLGDTVASDHYAPIDIDVTAGTFAAGSEIRVRSEKRKHPENANNDNYLSRFWKTESTGITAMTADIVANYSSSDVVGAEADIAHGTWSGALPWVKGAVIDAANKELTFSGETALADYTGITLAAPSVTITGGDFKCATGDSVNLTAVVIGDSNFTYSWTPAASLGNPTSESTTAGPSQTTDYEVTVTDGNGFSGTSPLYTVTVVPAPANPTTNTNISYCQGDTPTQLSASGTNLIWWIGTPGNQRTETAPLPTTATAGTQLFYVRDSIGSCLTDTIEIEVIINTEDDAAFDYGSTTFCQVGNSNAAHVTGLGGGSFSGSAGLVIDAVSGVIDLSATPIGSYEVRYLTNGPCPNEDTLFIDIVGSPDAGISYAGGPFCQTGSNPLPTYDSGTPTGTFTSQGGINFIDQNTGEIDLANSTPGTEYVYFTISAGGGCPMTIDSTSVTIDSPPASPTFTSPISYCENETASQLSATGTNVLWYSSTSGGTGDPSAPTPSTTTIGTTYFYLSQTVAGCESFRDSIEVIVNGPDDASFSYASNSYNQSQTDPLPNITGIPGGTFSSSNGIVLNPSSGEIDLDASTAGTYDIKYVTNGPCPDSSLFTVDITIGCTILFSYPNPICLNGTNPIATIDPATGTGTFSSFTVQIIDAATGEINLNSMSVGSGYVRYTLNSGGCAGAIDSVLVHFEDPSAPTVTTPIEYCKNAAATPLSANGNNLQWYNSASGGVGSSFAPTPNTSSLGSTDFYVSQTINGCESPRSLITVNVVEDDASFDYGTGVFCENGPNPSPTITGTPGGTFNGSAGLIINSSTGEIDITNSPIGTYTVTRSTNGNCPASMSITVEIVSNLTASFNYQSPVCLNDANPLPIMSTGSSSGTFGSLTVVFISTSTGEIDLQNTQAGTHRVYNYVAPQGSCPAAVDSSDIVISAVPTPPTVTPNFTYCENEQATSLSAGGVSLLWYNSPTGGNGNTNAPTPNTNAPGTTDYYVSQSDNGCESNRSMISVTVNANDLASFSYSNTSFCSGSPNETPTISGTQGGTFSSSAGLALNTSSGEINVSGSNVGSYIVKYLTTGACPDSSTVNVDIVSSFSASFTYTNPACNNAGNPLPIIPSGSSAGTFNSSSLNFVNNNTGEIDLATSANGQHRVYNYVAPSGACAAAIDSFDITIQSASPKPSSSGPIDYCQNEATTALQANGTNLLWYAPQASVGSATAPTPDSSIPGDFNFTVTQNTNGCESDHDTIKVTIKPLDDATFDYGDNAFCFDELNPLPSNVNTANGVFSGTNSLVINSSNGRINISASGVGTFDVTHTTNAICPNSYTITVVIDTFTNGSFYYAGNFCQGPNGINPIPTILPDAISGTFSSTNGLVFVDPTTGEIDINASTPGFYNVINTTQAQGSCPSGNHSSNIVVNPEVVLTVADKTITCGETAILQANVNVPGGAYLWTPGGNTTSTLAVTPITSQQYIVEYDAGNGCADKDTADITVDSIPVSLDPFDDACKTHPSFALSGGSPTGGIYSGIAISNNIFYPSQAQLGNNLVTYRVTQGNCTASTAQNIFVGECLGLNEDNNYVNYSLIPNPNKGLFKILLSQTASGQIIMHDMNGKVVLRSEFNSQNELNINANHLQNGVYIIEFVADQRIQHKRLVIQH